MEEGAEVLEGTGSEGTGRGPGRGASPGVGTSGWGRLTRSAREPSWDCLGVRSSLGANCRDTPWLWLL